MNISKRVQIFAVGGCLVVHLAAVLLTSVYSACGSHFDYVKPVDWAVIGRGFSKLNLATVLHVVGVQEWMLLCAIVAGLVLVRLEHRENGRNVLLAFLTVQPVVFLSGWIGLVLLASLPYEFWTKLDGEWFEEGSPFAIAQGIWILVSLLLGLAALPRRSASTLFRAPATH